jgi:predicted enzyme involved in methoxymalonyl-ACP biosynthesis
MTIESLRAWREPIGAEWRGEAAQLASDFNIVSGDSESVSRRLRRLSVIQLGQGERLQLRRLVKTAVKLPEFRLFRLLLVSNRTMSFVAGELEASGAARGLLIQTVEADYDSVHSLALNPLIEVPPGNFDAVFLLIDADFFPVGHGLLDRAMEAETIASIRKQLNELVAGLRSKCNAPVQSTLIHHCGLLASSTSIAAGISR